MPREVINRVAQLTDKNNNQSGLEFGDRHNNIDDDDDQDANADDDADLNEPDLNEKYHQSLFPHQDNNDAFDGYDMYSDNDSSAYDSNNDDGSTYYNDEIDDDISYNSNDYVTDDDKEDSSYDDRDKKMMKMMMP